MPPATLDVARGSRFMCEVVRGLRNGTAPARAGIVETLAGKSIARSMVSRGYGEASSCGSGRVLRKWTTCKRRASTERTTTAEMIPVVQDHLGFAHFETNELCPPCRGTMRRLPSSMRFQFSRISMCRFQKAWMAELRRALKPHGYLLITTHGEYCVRRLDEGQQAAFRAGEIVVHRGETSGTDQCSVFHPADWVTTHLLNGFVLLDHIQLAPRRQGCRTSTFFRRLMSPMHVPEHAFL